MNTKGKEDMITVPETIIIHGEEYYNQTDAAAYLGISSQTFRVKYDETGLVERFGNPRDEKEALYKVSDLQRLLEVRPKAPYKKKK